MQTDTREKLLTIINNTMLVLGALVIASLILEYGFYIDATTRHYLHIIDYSVFGFFVLHDFLKLAIVRDKESFLRYNRLNFMFIGLLIVFVLLYNPLWQLVDFSDHLQKTSVREIARIYIIITQIYIFISTLFNTVRFGQKYAFFRFQPIPLLLGSFAIIILLGTGLLLLPKATTADHIPFVDALFTSTSATCVTGLIVVDTGTYFTRMGQWVILMLIQAGGLGIMTMTAFFAVILGTRMSVRGRIVMRDLLADESMEKIGQTLWQVLGLTIFFETIGLIAIYQLFPDGAVQRDRFFDALFHSISAFCNAGFSTFSDSLMGFSENTMFVGTFAGLIIVGGIGFPVLVNLFGHRFYGTMGPFGKKKLRLNLHTSIVLWVSGILIVSGAVWIWVAQFGVPGEWEVSVHSIVGSFFQSITARTAGFNTIHIGSMATPAIIGLLILMFIGASPGSTGGGIKTTAFYTSFYALWARLQGKNYLEYRHRTIPNKLAFRSFMLILAAQTVIAVSFTLLTISENQEPMVLLFEAVSAFGTVGLSMGATPELSVFGRYVIIFTMFIGRVGPLALMIALGKETLKRNYEYPKESLMLG